MPSSRIGRALAGVLVLTTAGGWPLPACTARPADPPPDAETVALPSPRLESAVSLEETLRKRRSVRSYRDEPLSLAEVSQLLWAAQGVTLPAVGFRTAPSAGATFPLEVYLIAGQVTGLPAAVYHYRPHQHQLVMVLDGDVRDAVARAALRQNAPRQAPIVILIAAAYHRTAARYGDRAERYVHMEVGHAAQNVSLQAVALDLGSVVIGAFHDARIKRLVRLGADEQPLYLIAVGRL